MKPRRFPLLSGLLCCGLLSLAPADEVERSVVFTSGTEGYHTFRIPAVIVTPKGTVLAFCEGRKTSRADHGDIDLVLKRSTDGGRTWGPLELVYEEGGTAKITIGNPCPVIDQSTGRLWLPFCRDNRNVLVTFSDDDGRTWSAPCDITHRVKPSHWKWYATGPGVGIQLTRGSHAGRLVVPCDHTEPYQGRLPQFSHVFFSDDHGRTWKLGGTVGADTDECQVVELADGRLMLNMRNYHGRAGGQKDKDRMRAIAYSSDGGQSWSPIQFDRTLIEPICQASFLRYRFPAKGRDGILLFSNPASRTTRHRLTVRLSRDEGRTWPVARLLHAGPAAYSCLTVLPDGTIGCLFESGEKHPYETIVFARFPLTWLTDYASSGIAPGR